MIPVLTPAEMTEVDRRAPEPFEVLVDRAATKVAAAAVDLLGGTYGRRVVVVAGPGNNGADGRIAAVKLRRRGARVTVLDALGELPPIAGVDLVIDAAFGTGFRGEFRFPEVVDAPVLAVDIPSGVSGLTGEASGRPVAATATVTFAALKPGLLFAQGRVLSGAVRLVDIGLDTGSASVHLLEDSDVARWLPPRPVAAHKWNDAVWIFAGSPGMTGAAALCCRASFRAGAGYVRLSSAADEVSAAAGVETVHHRLAVGEWTTALAAEEHRFGAVVMGPGLGRRPEVQESLRRAVAALGRPLVIDGDGLVALGRNAAAVLSRRSAATVLTPHDGEFEALTGERPGSDRIAAARALAATTRATVLLKGPTTVVAAPDGAVLLSNSGDARLATAGTGDVLSGVIAAHLARGVPAPQAAAAAAFVHGRAALVGPARGLIASDVVAALPDAYASLGC